MYSRNTFTCGVLLLIECMLVSVVYPYPQQQHRRHIIPISCGYNGFGNCGSSSSSNIITSEANFDEDFSPIQSSRAGLPTTYEPQQYQRAQPQLPVVQQNQPLFSGPVYNSILSQTLQNSQLRQQMRNYQARFQDMDTKLKVMGNNFAANRFKIDNLEVETRDGFISRDLNMNRIDGFVKDLKKNGMELRKLLPILQENIHHLNLELLEEERKRMAFEQKVGQDFAKVLATLTAALDIVQDPSEFHISNQNLE